MFKPAEYKSKCSRCAACQRYYLTSELTHGHCDECSSDCPDCASARHDEWIDGEIKAMVERGKP